MLIKEQNAKRKSPTALNLNNVIALISINLSIHTVKTLKMPAHWCIYKLMFYIHLIKYLFYISEYNVNSAPNLLYIYIYIYIYIV